MDDPDSKEDLLAMLFRKLCEPEGSVDSKKNAMDPTATAKLFKVNSNTIDLTLGDDSDVVKVPNPFAGQSNNRQHDVEVRDVGDQRRDSKFDSGSLKLIDARDFYSFSAPQTLDEMKAFEVVRESAEHGTKDNPRDISSSVRRPSEPTTSNIQIRSLDELEYLRSNPTGTLGMLYGHDSLSSEEDTEYNRPQVTGKHAMVLRKADLQTAFERQPLGPSTSNIQVQPPEEFEHPKTHSSGIGMLYGHDSSTPKDDKELQFQATGNHVMVLRKEDPQTSFERLPLQPIASNSQVRLPNEPEDLQTHATGTSAMAHGQTSWAAIANTPYNWPANTGHNVLDLRKMKKESAVEGQSAKSKGSRPPLPKQSKKPKEPTQQAKRKEFTEAQIQARKERNTRRKALRIANAKSAAGPSGPSNGNLALQQNLPRIDDHSHDALNGPVIRGPAPRSGLSLSNTFFTHVKESNDSSITQGTSNVVASALAPHLQDNSQQAVLPGNPGPMVHFQGSLIAVNLSAMPPGDMHVRAPPPRNGRGNNSQSKNAHSARYQTRSRVAMDQADSLTPRDPNAPLDQSSNPQGRSDWVPPPGFEANNILQVSAVTKEIQAPKPPTGPRNRGGLSERQFPDTYTGWIETRRRDLVSMVEASAYNKLSLDEMLK